ncbi:MAG: hypothetical protein HC861_11200 [Rhodospirillaceae bacterium]|nr:hypothetical protein [Rhodospirillaceae bacterium]
MARDALKEARNDPVDGGHHRLHRRARLRRPHPGGRGQAAGLSVGIVNFYFKSKDVLLIETLRHLVADYIEQTNENFRNAGATAAAQVATMIESDFHRTVANRKKVTVWYAFWGETRWRPEFLKICQELSDSFHRETTDIFARLIVEGGYQNLDADLIARGFDAMIDGLWLDMLINPKAVDREAPSRSCAPTSPASSPTSSADKAPVAPPRPPPLEPCGPLRAAFRVPLRFYRLVAMPYPCRQRRAPSRPPFAAMSMKS